jgi:hypothetical protein
MHVCFSRGAIDAGTESVSHKPRSSLGEAVDFFQNGRYRRFEQTNEGSLLGVSTLLFLVPMVVNSCRLPIARL